MFKISKIEKINIRNIFNNCGVSLIELIVFIVVSGIISIGLMGVYQSFLNESTTPETIAKSNFLGQQKMEELTKYSFDNTNLEIDNDQETYVAATISGYEWYWKIEYIDDSLEISVDPTMYKKITVKVKDPGEFELKYYTIVTKRYNDE